MLVRVTGLIRQLAVAPVLRLLVVLPDDAPKLAHARYLGVVVYVLGSTHLGQNDDPIPGQLEFLDCPSENPLGFSI